MWPSPLENAHHHSKCTRPCPKQQLSTHRRKLRGISGRRESPSPPPTAALTADTTPGWTVGQALHQPQSGYLCSRTRCPPCRAEATLCSLLCESSSHVDPWTCRPPPLLSMPSSLEGAHAQRRQRKVRTHPTPRPFHFSLLWHSGHLGDLGHAPHTAGMLLRTWVWPCIAQLLVQDPAA